MSHLCHALCTTSSTATKIEPTFEADDKKGPSPDSSDLFPVEVKAGKKGSLRSLHQYVQDKPCRAAVRFDLNQPSRQDVDFASLTYELLSLPIYAATELNRLLLAYRRE